MLDYLQKFNNLPEDVREKVSSAQVMARMSELEGKYGLNLAAIVMRVMVDDIKIVDLAKFFVFEHGMDGRIAGELVEEMKKKIFCDVADFLGIITEDDRLNEVEMEERIKQEKFGVRSSGFFFSPEDEEEVQNLAKHVNDEPVLEPLVQPSIDEKVEYTVIESNASFSSEELNNRFRQVIKTLIKGIRNRIDAKQILMKPVNDGGLGMNMNLVERTIFIAEQCKRELAGATVAPIPRIKLPEDIARMTGAPTALMVSSGIEKPSVVLGGERDVAYNFGALAEKKDEVKAVKPKHTFRVGIEQLVASSKKNTEETEDYRNMPGRDSEASTSNKPVQDIDPWQVRAEKAEDAKNIKNITELGAIPPLDLRPSTPSAISGQASSGQVPSASFDKLKTESLGQVPSAPSAISGQASTGQVPSTPSTSSGQANSGQVPLNSATPSVPLIPLAPLNSPVFPTPISPLTPSTPSITLSSPVELPPEKDKDAILSVIGEKIIPTSDEVHPLESVLPQQNTRPAIPPMTVEKKEDIKPLDLRKESPAVMPETQPIPPIRIISPIIEGKKKMDDIKHVPKLVGPIEELREMTTVNFRRIDDDAKEVVTKFKKRIDLFEEEDGYGKKLEAIKAWRQSPVNTLYIQMGQEAIMQGGIAAVIQNRQANNQDYLTEIEFNAIMDFNKSIRF